MKIKNFLTIFFGKFLVKLLHLLGKDAGNFPGLVLWELNKNSLCAFKVNCPIIAVTGTNGKTSVTNYLNHIFNSTGKKIITNKLGNNLDTGICSLLLDNCNFKGEVDADYLVLEIDESHVPVIFSKLKLETLVILNFFRDQLDRNGEVETLILKIKKFLENYQGNLFLNGDDPNVARLGLANPNNKNVKYFSVEKYSGATENLYEAGEGRFCPICGTALNYKYYQYSHIGKFLCPNCSFGNFSHYVTAKNININVPSIELDGTTYKISHDNIYYIYNLTAVYSVAKYYNFNSKVLQDAFQNYQINNGRLEKFKIRGNNLLINLAKNPVGANMTLRVMNEHDGPKELLFVLNDNIADGQDVSWIWDINFSIFKNVTRVVTSGTRAHDIAIRIKCSGYDPNNIFPHLNLKEAVEDLFSTNSNKYVIANYTAIQPTRAEIKKYMEKMGE